MILYSNFLMNTLGKIPSTATATDAYMMKCEFKFNLVVGSSLAHMSYVI